MPEASIDHIDFKELNRIAISQPLVKHIYTADPSAHVFNGKIYIYPSHDVDAGIPFNDNGDHFGMEDYYVFSMESPESEAFDNGLALHVRDVVWAERQMWAPDAAEKDGKYYLYFPPKKPMESFKLA
jgi:GH43 family beta-xylosidase